MVLKEDCFPISVADIPTLFPLMVVLGGKARVLCMELPDELRTQPTGTLTLDPEWESGKAHFE